MSERKLPEPWLRGTLPDVPSVPRAVLHALELAGEDLERWCSPLNDEQLNQRPGGIAPVAFHLSHISRSLDRLLTYARRSLFNSTTVGGTQIRTRPRSHSRTTLCRTFHRVGQCSMPGPRSRPLGSRSSTQSWTEESSNHARRPYGSYRRLHPAPCRTSNYDCKDRDI